MHYEMGMETLLDPATMDPDLKSVAALTQWYTDVLEKIVRAAPEQYWWMHRRWRNDRGPKRRATQNRTLQNLSAQNSGAEAPPASNHEAA